MERISGKNSPRVLGEAAAGLVASGLEPSRFCVQWISDSGIAPKSGLAMEFMVLMHCVHYLAVEDRLDVTNLVTGERIARRLLQIQKAVARDPRQPEFGALSYYTKHMDVLWGGLHAPTLERHAAEEARADAGRQRRFEKHMAKSRRLCLDETVNDKKKKNKDKKDKEKGNRKRKGRGDAHG